VTKASTSRLIASDAGIAGSEKFSLGEEIVTRIDRLAVISEAPEHLARVFLTGEAFCESSIQLICAREVTFTCFAAPFFP
jgi:hypothetical protein